MTEIEGLCAGEQERGTGHFFGGKAAQTRHATLHFSGFVHRSRRGQEQWQHGTFRKENEDQKPANISVWGKYSTILNNL